MNRTLRRAGAATLTLVLGVAGAACGGDDPTEASGLADTSVEGRPTAGESDDASTDGSYPVTITSCGRDYTYDAAPERVVLGSPTSVETLAALGLEDSAVGYTAGDFGPTPEAADVPELSGEYFAAREAILAAEPDLFLANAELQVNGEEGTVSVDDLEQAGANAYVLGEYCEDASGATGIDAVYDDVEHLGAIYGVPEKADALVEDLRARVDAAARLGAEADAPRVAYVQIFDGVLYALAGAGYAATLDAVGTVNVFADVEENFAPISAEEVLTLDAQGIVFVYDFDGDEAAARAEVEELLAGTEAVQSSNLVGVPSHLPEGAGVTVVDVIEMVAEGLDE